MDFVEAMFATPQSNFHYLRDIESKLQDVIKRLESIERRLQGPNEREAKSDSRPPSDAELRMKQ